MNKVILIGNLSTEVETSTTQSGKTRGVFSVAVNRRTTDKDGRREADFFRIITWEQTAQNCKKYLSKGRKVAVEGAIQNRQYTAQDGSTRYITEITANNVEFLSTPSADAAASAATDAGNGFTNVPDDEQLPF